MILFYFVAVVIAIASNSPPLLAIMAALVGLKILAASTALAFEYVPDRWRHRMRLPLARLGIALPLVLAGCNGDDPQGIGTAGSTTTSITHTTNGTGGADADGGMPDAPATCSMSFSPCLSGHINGCADAGAVVSACCDGETPVQTCALPAGTLTNDCKTYLGTPCASGVCAVSVGGKVTCCGMINGMPDPCNTPTK